jgi:hypothetical protein
VRLETLVDVPSEARENGANCHDDDLGYNFLGIAVCVRRIPFIGARISAALPMTPG